MLYTEQNMASPAGTGPLPFVEVDYDEIETLPYGPNEHKMICQVKGNELPFGDIRDPTTSSELFVSCFKFQKVK